MLKAQRKDQGDSPGAAFASDAALSEALRRGDGAAAREFYARYAPRLYNFIFRTLGGPPEDAEDVLQETFMALAEALPFFRGDSTLFTFACAIAHRKAVGYIRASSRRTRLAAAVASTASSAAGESGAEDTDDEEVRHALAALRPAYREVLLLKYVEEFSVTEAARVIGLSEHAIESRLMRARRALRRLLGAKQ